MSEFPQTPEFKTKRVMDQVRATIVSGRYAPGFRLPTFTEMENEYDVGRAVIQQALSTLKRDGFIRSEGRRGLFVAENPPHLCQYGLVLPASPGESGWCQFMGALHNEAFRIEKTDPTRRFRFYYGIDSAKHERDSLQELRQDIDHQRLAGVVVHFASAPAIKDLFKHRPGLPRVFLWAGQESGVWPSLTANGRQLLTRALEYLKEQGRKRVAIIHMGGTNTDIDHRAMFAEAGLEYHAPWIQWVGRIDPEISEHLVSLLMDYRFETRPDALIVADDNLLVHIMRGLVASGIEVGSELQVVSHCNWPWPPKSVLPVTRIGFDLRDVFQRALAMLNEQQQDQIRERYECVPARFEWEI